MSVDNQQSDLDDFDSWRQVLGTKLISFKHTEEQQAVEASLLEDQGVGPNSIAVGTKVY